MKRKLRPAKAHPGEEKLEDITLSKSFSILLPEMEEMAGRKHNKNHAQTVD